MSVLKNTVRLPRHFNNGIFMQDIELSVSGGLNAVKWGGEWCRPTIGRLLLTPTIQTTPGTSISTMATSTTTISQTTTTTCGRCAGESVRCSPLSQSIRLI